MAFASLAGALRHVASLETFGAIPALPLIATVIIAEARVKVAWALPAPDMLKHAG